jgi:hypothetical protein
MRSNYFRYVEFVFNKLVNTVGSTNRRLFFVFLFDRQRSFWLSDGRYFNELINQFLFLFRLELSLDILTLSLLNSIFLSRLILFAFDFLTFGHLPHFMQSRGVYLMICFGCWRQRRVFLLRLMSQYETLLDFVREIVSVIGTKLVFFSETIHDELLVDRSIVLIH